MVFIIRDLLGLGGGSGFFPVNERPHCLVARPGNQCRWSAVEGAWFFAAFDRVPSS